MAYPPNATPPPPFTPPSPTTLFMLALWAASILSLCRPYTLHAQTEPVTLDIQPEHIGFQGYVRPGTWTSLFLTLKNQSNHPLQVRCQWTLPDSDADLVLAERTVTLTPQHTQHLWLYGCPKITTQPDDTWRIRVIDHRSNNLLATKLIRPPHLLDPTITAIGITGSYQLGLQPYSSQVTQYHSCQFLLDLDPRLLPDRWFGLSLLQALIWTPQSPDPTHPAIPPGTHRAIRQWVQRGGHLVIILPAVGDNWLDSPLSSLLPPFQADRLSDQPLPPWLGTSPHNTSPSPTIDLKALNPLPTPTRKISVLLRNHRNQPIVVAGQFGLGRVTVIGLDLTDPTLTRLGLPTGPDLWKAIFGWQSPAFTEKYLENQIQDHKIAPAIHRDHFPLDFFISSLIAMHETASPALVAAIILFAVYWLAAGPFGFAMLKKRGLTHHSWVLFVAVVAIFTAIAWAGAAILRPRQPAIKHFTVLTADSQSGLVHAHSWLTLFLPKRGPIAIMVSPDPTSSHPNTLASPGLSAAADDSGFIDPQQYTLPTSAPDRATIPIRATAKQFEIDCLFPPEQTPDQLSLSPAWRGPQGHIKLIRGKPVGSLTHRLPSQLHNVLLVYCPGDGQTPVVQRHTQPWPAQQPLAIDFHQPSVPLVLPHQYDDKGKRAWKREGFLGQLIALKTAQTWDTPPPEVSPRSLPNRTLSGLAADKIVKAIELLSFYNMLPPPDYRNTHLIDRAANYDRTLGRHLDLTALTTQPCLILIAHMENSPLPIPLAVDGQLVFPAAATDKTPGGSGDSGGGASGGGWTVVRWVCSFDQPRQPR